MCFYNFQTLRYFIIHTFNSTFQFGALKTWQCRRCGYDMKTMRSAYHQYYSWNQFSHCCCVPPCMLFWILVCSPKNQNKKIWSRYSYYWWELQICNNRKTRRVSSLRYWRRHNKVRGLQCIQGNVKRWSPGCWIWSPATVSISYNHYQDGFLHKNTENN